MEQRQIKPNSVVKIPCNLSDNFYNWWLTFLTPIHKLTPSTIAIAAEILKQRRRLGKDIKNEEILDTFLLTNENIRNEIIEACGISVSNYHVSIGKLKKAGFFINNRVNPKFIPRIDDSSEDFKLMLIFEQRS